MDAITEKLKLLELDIFRQFIEICSRHSLTYFVLGGTALGAVRHKGFIPWDDDIDVALPREDYEAFLRIAQQELPEHLFLQTYVTDVNYPLPFAKIRDCRTTFMETAVSDIQMNHGVYFDIFPLDGYPEKRLPRFWFRLRKKLLKTIVAGAFRIDADTPRGKRMLLKLIRALFPDYRKALRRLDRLHRKYAYQTSETVANFCGAWGDKEIMPRAFFGAGTEGEFEGIRVVLPERTHDYLHALYGDYMQLPPPEKRVTHHLCKVIDLERPYQEYTDRKN